MKMIELYEEFEVRGLTTSQRHFSAAWLGRGESYLAQKKHHELTADVAVCLWKALTIELEHELAARVLLAVLDD